MDKAKVIDKLNNLITKLDNLPQYQYGIVNSEFDQWYREARIALGKMFLDAQKLNEFENIHFTPRVFIGIEQKNYVIAHKNGRIRAKNLLNSIKEEIIEYGIESGSCSVSEIDIIEKILINFHRCYRQLLIRHGQRSTINIVDEYDVQDLLHALFKSYFDDVRAEVSTAQYAGSNSRIDFILNEHDIAIEVKKTRQSLKDKEIGEELLIDIARYQQSYPKIKILICFVYDPEGLIINPIGLESDLNNTPSNIKIKTIICPKH